MYIFLDESGNLGFDWSKKHTKQYFVITILTCDRAAMRQFRKAVRRTLKHINFKTSKKRVVQELKGSETDFKIKKYFYRQLDFDNWNIYSVTVNKKRIYEDLQDKTGKKKNFIIFLLVLF